MLFPITHKGVLPSLRTSEKFCGQEYIGNHRHAGKPLTILSEIPNFDVVLGLPPDPMHQFDMGVAKRLAKEILEGMTDAQIKRIDLAVGKFGHSLPSSMFPRKISALSNYSDWKATEGRQFLLYAIPAVLSDFLPPDKYLSLCRLSAALKLLSSWDLSDEAITLAEIELYRFVDWYPQFSAGGPIYCIHMLTHVGCLYRYYGPIITFSCYPFE